jgi:hypothetical protein
MLLQCKGEGELNLIRFGSTFLFGRIRKAELLPFAAANVHECPNSPLNSAKEPILGLYAT